MHPVGLRAATSSHGQLVRLRYGSANFSVVTNLSGITADDEQYLTAHPGARERWRPVLAGEVDLPDATDVYVYPHLHFDGSPAGRGHRMVLHRAGVMP